MIGPSHFAITIYIDIKQKRDSFKVNENNYKKWEMSKQSSLYSYYQ